MRRPFVAGNWKMNTDMKRAKELAAAVLSGMPRTDKIEIGLCPPFVYLDAVFQVIKGSSIKLGAQDVYIEREGAFTGEISAYMLRDVGCEYVIIGHSERRHIIGEGDELINKKLKAAVGAGLRPILCVGEKLEQRERGITEKVVEEQLEGGLADLDSKGIEGLVIAYEPVWAIGTGHNATAEQAEEVHRFIRSWLEGRFGRELAESIRIQYGGSVKPENAYELMSQPNVDGALVGGASLKAESFLGIIKETLRAKNIE